jgi:hypothetical protein
METINGTLVLYCVKKNEAACAIVQEPVRRCVRKNATSPLVPTGGKWHLASASPCSPLEIQQYAGGGALESCAARRPFETSCCVLNFAVNGQRVVVFCGGHFGHERHVSHTYTPYIIEQLSAVKRVNTDTVRDNAASFTLFVIIVICLSKQTSSSPRIHIRLFALTQLTRSFSSKPSTRQTIYIFVLAPHSRRSVFDVLAASIVYGRLLGRSLKGVRG